MSYGQPYVGLSNVFISRFMSIYFIDILTAFAKSETSFHERGIPSVTSCLL